MAEVTTGIPEQRGDADDPDVTGDALAVVAPAAPDQEGDTRMRDAAERMSALASETAERVGDVASEMAGASGRIAARVVDRLRNNAELAAERGTTVIADEVVEKVAGIAAREVPGVHDLGGDVSRVFAVVRERVGLGEADEDTNRGVSVRLEGGVAAVKIVLVIEYGFVVHSVTEKVRTKVIGAVENLLGLEVSVVDIVVDDIHVEDKGPVGDDEARAAGY